MPNWCFNRTTVMGTKRDIRVFLKAISNESSSDESYDMNKLVPLDPRAVVEQKIMVNGKEDTHSYFATGKEHGFDGMLHAHDVWGIQVGRVSR